MAPILYTANARMVFGIAVNGLVHEQHIACDYVPSGISPAGAGLVAGALPGGVADPQAAADNWWGYVKSFYQSSTPPASWRLDGLVGGAFVPVAGGVAAGGNGTSGGAYVPASILTFTFKDGLNHRVNFLFSETSIPIPSRFIIGSLYANMLAYVNSVLSDGTTLEIGSWARSRGDEDIDRFLAASATISKRLRKQRGLL